ncbi:T9SS type A sorting domain-containing protein [Flavihumibacter solisilvae]|uniref:Secretion system C-terminal sorting domain-containing protein n=1 Tax=Flavihumibacter solisilvae TaxID=1349421 RepID=A0A0C1ISD2_9BACT|nr:T9SS type A sorting domain-containing protein [Flavihumibacter solisilvae]KIC93359.1 hypothetical protein OI18_16350 [Flavihumibacter solisilvae]
MKKLLLVTFVVAFGSFGIKAQVIQAMNKAAFGVDGEVISAKLNGASQATANSHDWFSNSATNFPYTPPIWIIDTSGAKSITDRYVTDINSRRLPFFRTMSYPQFTRLNGNTLIDAIYIRDYHGIDSTTFAMSNKNGDNPSLWTGATETNIPDKNDILDTYVHVRRAQKTAVLLDSLWFIGGIALDATNGNRYFDFELYQTDIFYSRQTRKFTGTGPEDGHTAWKFDPVSGAVTTPGDVIFTAEFGGSGLQNLVARIWVHRDAMNLNSPNFAWGGLFDGAGGNYGYASILPRQGGNFYSGLQNSASTWAGPFKLVKADNSVQDNFSPNQFLEFAVNMTYLGLDPMSLLGGNACGLPFSRILIKTRSSSSFSAELKDFVGPFDFFTFNPVSADADIPFICGESVSTITVTNAMPTSVYTWSTADGNIISGTTGPEITVDAPGTYIVKQQLMAGCGEYALDTVVIDFSNSCNILPANRLKLTGKLAGQEVNLDFEASSNENVSYYIVERSTDGKNFQHLKTITNNNSRTGTVSYPINDNVSTVPGEQVYYRVKLIRIDNSVRYSPEVALKRVILNEDQIQVLPNPVTDRMQLVVNSKKNQLAVIKIFNAVGALMDVRKVSLYPGNNLISYEGLNKWASGTYPITLETGDRRMTGKMIMARKR